MISRPRYRPTTRNIDADVSVDIRSIAFLYRPTFRLIQSRKCGGNISVKGQCDISDVKCWPVVYRLCVGAQVRIGQKFLKLCNFWDFCFVFVLNHMRTLEIIPQRKCDHVLFFLFFFVFQALQFFLR